MDTLPMAAVASAAEKILRADILLVAVGAGFSGTLPTSKRTTSWALTTKTCAIHIGYLPTYLPTYDMSFHETYASHVQIYDDMSIFLGFWGESFNQYRNTTPHAGYDILKRWKQRLTCQLIKDKLANNNPTNTTTSPFFVFTSNVDSHCTRVFAKNEVYDVHGNTDDRYHAWEDAVEDVLQQHPSKRLVVETVRENNEELVQAVLEGGGQATLIRVNPEVEDEDDSELSYPHLLSIHATGLATLQAIDHVIQSGLVAIPPCN
ncbi:hypothetical protein DYB34_003224 [Aphanomyces astaci]|uniref:Deacetylase sirtuin-type domain-containing protein n=1 Tax=Aphanomyces astaci TaxID=112090 RepID=A0A3R6VVB5_APHAT|nr:hypothetical protein DYB34_003224 [Aphanomyces astaci]